ncbi:MAG: hypothetical protein MK220_01905 [Candidatus Poseidoniia archaeon]|nr:hypothetical protein [Candidatus Poseidoniia archaeon]
MRFTATAVVLLLLAAGCLGTSPSGDDSDDGDIIAAPAWELGHWWVYAVSIPEAEVVTTMVVGKIDEEDYHLGSSRLLDAQRHAVLNHNPALGRIRISDMALYEQDVPQPLLQFPLGAGASWNFSLFGVERFDASVVSVTDGKATIAAEAATGERLDYVYDASVGWLSSFERVGSDGSQLVRMLLVELGTGYSGEAWFCRGGDLYEGMFAGPDFEFYDTAFANDGHVRYGPWSYIVYWLEADIGSSGSGELVLRDHDGEQLTEVFTPGNSFQELGVVTGASGNWTLQVSLSGDADVRILIAGAIEYGWTL